MNLATFHELLTPAGQAALTDAHALATTDAAFLSCFEKLRKHHEPELSKAALKTTLLRRKAEAKFSQAERMYFTREALEQATGEVAARHRARRFSTYGTVADLCCGIGGDALALAASGPMVHAVESNPLRLAMAQANAHALGLADRITFHQGDALTTPLSPVKAAFADPARRTEGRRHIDPENYTPSLSALCARFAAGFPLAVKIAPGISWDDIAGLDAEVEFVSVEGELKECVLWFGPFRSTARRATLLPDGATLSADSAPLSLPLAAPDAYLFDPDSAVVRAALASHLARELRIAPIDHTVQIFTGHEPIASPFVTTYRVEFTARFHAAALREWLREHRVGRVTIIKRGSMIDADELVGKLKLAGSEHRVVMLTRAAGEPVMIVCEGVTASSV